MVDSTGEKNVIILKMHLLARQIRQKHAISQKPEPEVSDRLLHCCNNLSNAKINYYNKIDAIWTLHMTFYNKKFCVKLSMHTCKNLS